LTPTIFIALHFRLRIDDARRQPVADHRSIEEAQGRLRSA
jgi:hypothetical protein